MTEATRFDNASLILYEADAPTSSICRQLPNSLAANLCRALKGSVKRSFEFQPETPDIVFAKLGARAPVNLYFEH